MWRLCHIRPADKIGSACRCVSYRDPFGLKMCFAGTRSEVRQLESIAKTATNSSFRLDRDNCVIESSVRSLGNSRFGSLRSLFNEYVNSEDYTFTVRFTRDASSTQTPFHINIFIDAEDRGYPTGSAYGQCDGGMASMRYAQLFAHEMIHHDAQLDGKPLPAGTPEEERRAIIRGDNAFNAAVGRPLRCAH